MTRRTVLATVCAALFTLLATDRARAQFPTRAFGRAWGHTYRAQEWERFYHYPYVYYPQNFWSSEYFQSSDHLYYRYPPEMRIPVYNKQWHNPYPEGRKYHSGSHFITDTF